MTRWLKKLLQIVSMHGLLIALYFLGGVTKFDYQNVKCINPIDTLTQYRKPRHIRKHMLNIYILFKNNLLAVLHFNSNKKSHQIIIVYSFCIKYITSRATSQTFFEFSRFGYRVGGG